MTRFGNTAVGRRLALGVALAVLGILIGRASASPHAADRVAKNAQAQPSERGDVAAATRYLADLTWDVLIDDQRRRRVIERHAVPDAVAGLDAQLATVAEGLRAAVTEPPVVARSTVLGYRVEDFSPERATVSIWGMALFGTGAYEATTQWSTSRIELAWSGDRWRIASVRSRGGPSPDSKLKTLAAAVRRFREMRHVP